MDIAAYSDGEEAAAGRHVVECVAHISESVLPRCKSSAPAGEREPDQDGALCQPEPADGIARAVIEVRPFDPQVCRAGAAYSIAPFQLRSFTSGTSDYYQFSH